MRLAVEHIDQELKASERQLAEAREGLKAAQRSLDESTSKVARLIQRNHDLTEALTMLRNASQAAKAAEQQKPSPAPSPTEPAERATGKLSLRQRPDPAALKISDAR